MHINAHKLKTCENPANKSDMSYAILHHVHHSTEFSGERFEHNRNKCDNCLPASLGVHYPEGKRVAVRAALRAGKDCNESVILDLDTIQLSCDGQHYITVQWRKEERWQNRIMKLHKNVERNFKHFFSFIFLELTQLTVVVTVETRHEQMNQASIIEKSNSPLYQLLFLWLPLQIYLGLTISRLWYSIVDVSQSRESILSFLIQPRISPTLKPSPFLLFIESLKSHLLRIHSQLHWKLIVLS